MKVVETMIAVNNLLRSDIARRQISTRLRIRTDGSFSRELLRARAVSHGQIGRARRSSRLNRQGDARRCFRLGEPTIRRLALLLVAGYLLLCHGCHGDEDTELLAIAGRRAQATRAGFHLSSSSEALRLGTAREASASPEPVECTALLPVALSASGDHRESQRHQP